MLSVSVTVTVICAAPVCPATGFSVMLRTTPLPPSAMFPFGSNPWLDEVADTFRLAAAVSASPTLKEMGPTWADASRLWLGIAEIVGGVCDEQMFCGEALLCGFGAAVTKSRALLSLSMQPQVPLATSLALPRKSAVVFDGAGAGPVPSAGVEPEPNATRSTTRGSGNATAPSALVVFANATLPAVALTAILVLIASGVGNAV